MPKTYGVTSDYEYNATHKRDKIRVWSGAFFSVFEAEGYSLPGGDGYMLTTYNGDKVRVTCPARRNGDNYRKVDAAVSAALRAHYAPPELECSYCASYAVKWDGSPSGLHRTAGSRRAIVKHADGHPLGDPLDYPVPFDEDLPAEIPVDLLP
jgi:hypothetical protein